MRIISIILFVVLVFLKVIAIESFCIRDCDSSEFAEVCAKRPNSDKKIVVKNRCLLDRQICYDTEFGSATYEFLHDGCCEGWDGWTYEEVGQKPCFADHSS
ncbi:hypothetical protein HA402_002581 [Bradysia odoriphaga]|nr:hypothetical protein HA402_002581 [Bradysia odoriphaga]